MSQPNSTNNSPSSPTGRTNAISTTHSHGELLLKPGKAVPFGTNVLADGGINFSVYSRDATGCDLILYKLGEKTPFDVIPFEREFQIGDVYCMTVYGLDYHEIEYGYRMHGPFNPTHGDRFDGTKTLLDPYARLISGRNQWDETPDSENKFQHRGRIHVNRFDWKNDRPLQIPIEDLVIYEMHVRGFSISPTSGVQYPGTFDAIREKIPYLKELGVNCIELMPVFEFDHWDNSYFGQDGEQLKNLWGYSTVGFFSPKAAYATNAAEGQQADEFKSLIQELHANGIEVILDVVFNHTAEGNQDGPFISFRGLDNRTYYMLTPLGDYINISGTGNTMNCNNPVVRHLIIDCLRYWITDYHVDGFRFDLAMILQRGADGNMMEMPPLLELMDYDPVLADCKLIAEAWDTHGYQVGSFPSCKRWAEWNGLYRDTARRFLKSDAGMARAMSDRMLGSPELYTWKHMGTRATINFITCHDGFTLNDLWSYNEKHNEANGESGRDGCNDSTSWNCGVEGETDDPEINTMRTRQVKNSIALLLASRGTPMLLAGDEMGHTQSGNNNAYCQDNEISWLNWDDLDQNSDTYQFMRRMIEFRHQHPVLRDPQFPTFEDNAGSGVPDVSLHGVEPWEPDFSSESRVLSILWDGHSAMPGCLADDSILIMMNMWWEEIDLAVPKIPRDGQWHQFVNTGLDSPDDITEPGKETPLPRDISKLTLGPRSVAILIYRDDKPQSLLSRRTQRYH